MNNPKSTPFKDFEYVLDEGSLEFHPDSFSTEEYENAVFEESYDKPLQKTEAKEESKPTKHEIEREKSVVEPEKEAEEMIDEVEEAPKEKETLRTVAQDILQRKHEIEDTITLDEELIAKLKEVLTHLDELFINLPEDVITDFARSEIYEKYNEVMDHFEL